MRFKVTNWMPPSENGEEIRIEVVYDTFEDVVDKIVKDLNSFWKGMIPKNQTFNIMSVDENTPLGIRVFQNDKQLATNQDSTINTDMFEIANNFNKRYFKYIEKPAGMLNEESIKKMKDIMGTMELKK